MTDMKMIETDIPGVLIFEPKVWGDARGFFLETFHAERYREAGIQESFVQDNLSFSRQGVLRGLHFQNPKAQGKLVYVLQGSVWDVAVDIRRGSPTFGRWTAVELSGDNKRQIWVPPGMAHGFVVTSETALFAYKCTELYAPANEHAILWNDPDLGIKWPVEHPSLSAKDLNARRLRDFSAELLVTF